MASAAEGLGLAVAGASPEGVALGSVRVVDRSGSEILLRTHVLGDWLLLPVQETASQVGVTVAWDRESDALILEGRPVFGAFIIENRAFLPHDRLAELLGVRIRWSPSGTVAALETAEVTISSRGRRPASAQGFVWGSEVYVPLRLVTDHLQYTLGWNQATKTAYIQGIPIRGVVREGRVYAAVSALRDVIPALEYRWNEEEFRLTLVFNEG